ncbi:DUF1049 domain-containing protein [Streptomyces sp. NPDC127068]|uniref:DUF1049 domain-containing protein n=1 Tax=Streptomyces sp. NPDC127068 TaxID=3347127 RepID=UPI003668C879
MSPRTTTSTKSKSSVGELATPGRIVVIVLAILALIFIFENTQDTKIRLLIPEVTMPLWLALLAMWIIGAVCGAYFMRRRGRR